MKTFKFMLLLSFVAIINQNATAKGQSYSAGTYQIKVNSFLYDDSENQGTGKNNISRNDKDDKNIRLYNKAEYQILSNAGIIIYSKTSLVLQGKGPKPTKRFYFSENDSSPILLLTISNLESVYAKNKKFIYAVESLFKSDSDLSSYDAYNKQFKLAYLYTENTK